MASAQLIVAASLGFLTFASGAILRTVPENTLSSGAVAPGLDSVMASLANFDTHGLSQKELEDMEAAVEDLIKKGDDGVTKIAIQQLQTFVLNTLIPRRKQAQKEDQDRLDLQFAALSHCYLDRRIEHSESVRRKVSAAEDHKEDYAEGVAKHGGCLQVLDGKVLLRDAYCHDVKNAAEICHCDRKMVDLFGSRNKDCESAPEIAAENQKCCDAFYEHEKQHADCTKIRTSATYAEKQHEIIMSKLCKAYDNCYDSKLQAYKAMEKEVKQAEKFRSWPSMYRLKCLFSSLQEGKAQSGGKSCKEKHYDIPGINYRTVPIKESCQSSMPAVPA